MRESAEKAGPTSRFPTNPTSTPNTTTPQTHREPPHPIPIEHVDPDALKTVRRLKRYGHTAYLVGGCVRDLLLGRTPKDFDVGTSARPRQAKHLFRNSRIIGRRFRLVHVVFGKKVIELATFRSTAAPPELPENPDADGVEDGDRPTPNPDETPAAGNPAAKAGPDDDEDLLIRSDNVFGTPEQDAFRRDFTVNGLFYDPETEQVIDHVGGLADLERRVLRTIGDPDVRFREDPVRIVRAVKFAARLHFAIEPATFDAMLRTRSELAKAAPPRLAEEVVRLAQGGAGAESYRLMADLGILQYIAPAVSETLARANLTAGTKPSLDAGPAGLFWKQLEAIDRWSRGPNDLTRATILACVYGPVYREALAASPNAQRDPGAAFFTAIRPAIQDRLLSRREADRIKLIYVAQRRLESPPNPRDMQDARSQQAPPAAPQGGRGGPAAAGGRRRRRRGGGAQGFATRDYFREAVAFFKLDAQARGKPAETWAAWEALLPQAPPPREVLPFRRRSEETVPEGQADFHDDDKIPTAAEIEAVNRLPDDEEFQHRRRRRRGGRISENARERERMTRTAPGESGGVPAVPKTDPEWMGETYSGDHPRAEGGNAERGPGAVPVVSTGENATRVSPLPRLTRPTRARERAVTPPAPVVPKATPQERILRAMASESTLINPYTNRAYVPRKFFPEEIPTATISTDASGQVIATASAPAASAAPDSTYSLDEFEPEIVGAAQEARRESTPQQKARQQEPRRDGRPPRDPRPPRAPRPPRNDAPRNDGPRNDGPRNDAPREARAPDASRQARTPDAPRIPNAPREPGAPAGEGDEARRKRRRRGRRGRGRGRGPGGNGPGSSGGPGNGNDGGTSGAPGNGGGTPPPPATGA